MRDLHVKKIRRVFSNQVEYIVLRKVCVRGVIRILVKNKAKMRMWMRRTIELFGLGSCIEREKGRE